MSERGSKHHVADRSTSARSLLDDWIGEVGEEGVVAIVDATIRAAHDGSIPSFTEREDILAYWNTRYPQR